MGCPQLLFGGAAIASGRFGQLKEVQSLLELLKVVGISRIDIAPIYPMTSPGGAEKLLGQCAPSSFTIDTKIMVTDMTGKGTLKADAIETSIIGSLERLNTDVYCFFSQKPPETDKTAQIHTLYCHMPDPETPLVDTAAALDKRYKAKSFQKVRV